MSPCPPHATPYSRSYAFLYHQMSMLEDRARTGAYYNACMQVRPRLAGPLACAPMEQSTFPALCR